MIGNDFTNTKKSTLISSIKGLKIISYTLMIVVGLLLSLSIYGLLFKENNSTFIALIVVGASCGSIIPIQLISIKKMKTELKRREKEPNLK